MCSIWRSASLSARRSGKSSTRLSQDILMPPIGRLLGHVDFSNLFVNLSGDALPHDRGGQSGGRGDAQLRPFPEYGDQFPDRGVCGVPAGAPGQSFRAEAGARSRARHARLPVLPERRARSRRRSARTARRNFAPRNCDHPFKGRDLRAQALCLCGF